MRSAAAVQPSNESAPAEWDTGSRSNGKRPHSHRSHSLLSSTLLLLPPSFYVLLQVETLTKVPSRLALAAESAHKDRQELIKSKQEQEATMQEVGPPMLLATVVSCLR